MPDYVTFSLEQDSDELEQVIYDAVQAQFPDWEPRKTQLETIISEAIAQVESEILTLAADVPLAIFRFFGPLVGVQPVSAAPATATTTWTFTTNPAGRNIPAGTQIAFDAPGDIRVPFETVNDVTIASPTLTTSAGQVQIRAIDDGEIGNGFTGDPELLDVLDFVATIDLVTTTAGGQDEEDDDAYLNRFSDQLTLLTFTPVLEVDVEAFVRTQVSDISRVKAFDNYDPTTDSSDVERIVGVTALVAGVPADAGKKTEIETKLMASRETNFVFKAFDATINTIGVTVVFKCYRGWTVSDVEGAVRETLTEYFATGNWAQPATGETQEWIIDGSDVVRYGEVWSVIDRVEGVNYLTSLQIKLGAGALGTADLNLLGKAPLTTPGTLSVTGVSA